MTRIIAGTAKGRRLRTPPGDRTRPTSDRVREAMFAALESSVGALTGLRFLDLYAGSGAVGLEALSRGAAAATLVESDRRTAALVRDNAETLGFTGAEVLAMRAEKALARPPVAPYDVAFLDPPYAVTEEVLAGVLAALAGPGRLTSEAVLIVERSKRSPEPAWPPGITPTASRGYGETVLWWAVANAGG